MAKYREELKLWLSTHPEDKPSKWEKIWADDVDSDADKRKGDKSEGRPKAKTPKVDYTDEEAEEEKGRRAIARAKATKKGKVEEPLENKK